MFQTIIFNCSDMKACNQKNQIRLFEIIRINRKLTWEKRAIIKKWIGLGLFGTVH